MDRRTMGIIGTMVTIFLCGIPGLVGLCFGAVIAAGLVEGIDPGAALATGLAVLCLGLIGVATPILVGVLTLRRKAAYNAQYPDEPIPPAH